MGAILVVGPLPPPVHGFSAATVAMVKAFRSRGSVEVVNSAGDVLSLITAFFRAIRFVVSKRPSAVYLAMSGGYRQLADLVLIAAARLVAAFLRYELRVCVHHHSFGYLDEKSKLAALMVRALGAQARHIALCDAMSKRLLQVYPIAKGNVHVLSNSILVERKSESRPVEKFSRKRHSGSIVLGHLSNLTEEKGVFAFLDLCARLKREGRPVEALVAGPLSSKIAYRFEAALENTGARHLGPVYGERKAQFFASIDVLVFPTRYKNEAEPLVIWESFSHGVPVLSYARGCIRSIVPPACGHVVEPEACDDPISDLHSTVIGWINNRSDLHAAEAHAQAHFEFSSDVGHRQLSEIIDWLFDDR